MNEPRFILAGSVIDGSSTGVSKNIYLKVKDGCIADIGSIADLPDSDSAVIDDFSHCTILPAFVDCSVSLARSPSVDSKVQLADKDASFEIKTTTLEKHVSYCHAYGVLGVADSDTPSELVEHFFTEMAPQDLITIKTFADLSMSKKVGSPEKPATDFIKINYSANIDDPNVSDISINYVTLCKILQNRGNQKAIVVANGKQHVAEALNAGCDAIEQGYDMGEENLKRIAKDNVLWIPSVLRAKNGLDSSGSSGDVCCRFSQRYVAPGKALPGAEEYWKNVLSDQLAQLRLAKELGVTTAIGTGAGSIGILHGESMAEEIKLFIKAGYSLQQAIRCASENGANFLGMSNLGTLTVGNTATFLITRGTVNQLPRKLSYLEGIYIHGVPSSIYGHNP